MGVNGNALSILHIASLSGDACTGVNVVVPRHVKSQGAFAATALYNVYDHGLYDAHGDLLLSEVLDVRDVFAFAGRPNLAIFHEAYISCFPSISKVLTEGGVPYVIVPHGELTVAAQKKKAFKKTLANILYFRSFFNGAIALQCLSEGELKRTYFGKTKIIGANGIDVPDGASPHASSYDLRIVYIGRLEVEIKGLDIMLDAVAVQAALLRRNGATLTICGPDFNGRFDRVREMISNRGLGDIVRLRRGVIGKEKDAILRQADLFFQTSRTEGLPLGILEAMAYGVPCVVTKGTQLGEFIESHNSGWVGETDVESIAKVLEEAVAAKAEERLARGQRARSSVREEFEWGVVSSNTVEQYKSLIGWS